jgi:response regulator RpfG family c-di-GMP phosphodiesterase
VSAQTQSRPTLLLIDDEARILSALRRELRKEGYEILTAETAESALRIADEHHVDAVLSDHKMPGTTGLVLLAELSKRQPKAALMLITGWTEEIPREALDAVGVCALITKPWDGKRLKATLRAAVAMSS